MAEFVIILFATFLVAGTVKGVVGMGFPAVSLAILTLTLGLQDAMALMIVPSLLTNIWQAFSGNALIAIVKRLWLLLIMILVGVWIGTWWLALSDAHLLSALLGVLLLVYAIYGLATPTIRLPSHFEPWLSPAVGLVNGVVTGLVGTFFMPSVPYLQSLGLQRDRLVQAMGVVFSVSTAGLAFSLSGFGLMTGELAIWSVAGVIPAILGMITGRRIRKRLDENRFRQVFLGALLLLGAAIALRALT